MINYEEQLCVSTGYFSQTAIDIIARTSVTAPARMQANRFYICMSYGNFWQEKYFVANPTRKQRKQAIKEFVACVDTLNDEWCEYCEASVTGEFE